MELKPTHNNYFLKHEFMNKNPKFIVDNHHDVKNKIESMSKEDYNSK